MLDRQALLAELERRRKLTFRQGGEGTGTSLDLDVFGGHYPHLILWDKKDEAIAGTYLLAWKQNVIPLMGL